MRGFASSLSRMSYTTLQELALPVCEPISSSALAANSWGVLRRPSSARKHELLRRRVRLGKARFLLAPIGDGDAVHPDV
jgi:hypothetical protein